MHMQKLMKGGGIPVVFFFVGRGRDLDSLTKTVNSHWVHAKFSKSLFIPSLISTLEFITSSKEGVFLISLVCFHATRGVTDITEWDRKKKENRITISAKKFAYLLVGILTYLAKDNTFWVLFSFESWIRFEGRGGCLLKNVLLYCWKILSVKNNLFRWDKKDHSIFWMANNEDS